MKTREKKRTRSISIDRQVEGQLDTLSQMLEQTTKQYVLRLQREISGVLKLLPAPAKKGNLRPKEAKKLQRMSKVLSALQIKPTKGRRKDLKRIDELIGELENLVQEK